MATHYQGRPIANPMGQFPPNAHDFASAAPQNQYRLDPQGQTTANAQRRFPVRASAHPMEKPEGQTVVNPRRRRLGRKTILDAFLQVVGVTTAILFGAFSIMSWQDAERAKAQADDANDMANDANDMAAQANNYAESANDIASSANAIALAALCAQIGSGGTDASLSDLCSTINSAAEASLSMLASSLFPSAPWPTTTFGVEPTSTSSSTPTTTPHPGAPGSSTGLSRSSIVGIVVGIVAAVAAIFILLLNFCWKH